MCVCVCVCVLCVCVCVCLFVCVCQSLRPLGSDRLASCGNHWSKQTNQLVYCGHCVVVHNIGQLGKVHSTVWIQEVIACRRQQVWHEESKTDLIVNVMKWHNVKVAVKV